MDQEKEKVAIYIRTSKEEQHPENQLRLILERVEREGWKYDVFEEKETTRKTRPIKNELYNRLLKKDYDIVIVWRIDRWARSMKELLTDIETLFKRNVKFISVRENIDLSTPEGKLQFHIIAAFAEFERAIISARTKEGLARTDKPIGRPKGSKDKNPRGRKKSGYYERWAKKNR